MLAQHKGRKEILVLSRIAICPCIEAWRDVDHVPNTNFLGKMKIYKALDHFCVILFGRDHQFQGDDLTGSGNTLVCSSGSVDANLVGISCIAWKYKLCLYTRTVQHSFHRGTVTVELQPEKVCSRVAKHQCNSSFWVADSWSSIFIPLILDRHCPVRDPRRERCCRWSSHGSLEK